MNKMADLKGEAIKRLTSDLALAERPFSRLSVEQFATAMEYSPIGTGLIALDGGWLWTNRVLNSLLGYDACDLEQISLQKVTHPDDVESESKGLGLLLDGELSAYQSEKRCITKDGSTIWCLLTISVVRDADQQPDYFMAKIQDVTQRKSDEAEREELMQRLALATRAGGVGVWEWDIATDGLTWNDQMFALYGRDPDEVSPSYEVFRSAVRADHRERVDHLLAEAVAGRHEYNTEFPIITGPGEVRYIRATGTVVRDSAGTATRMIGTNWDVSAERRLSLVEREQQRFSAAVQAVEGVLWTNDATGRMVGEQPGWAALTGQDFEDYQGYGWAKAVHPDDSQPTVDAWNEAVAERRTFVFEHRVKRHDGEWRLFAIRAVPLLDIEDESLLEWVGVHTDITDQRRAETELREANAQLADVADEFRTLAEGMPELCWMARPDGSIYWYNQHWYKYTGTVAADMEGWGWQSVHDPDVLPDVVERWKDSIDSGKNFEMTFPIRGADGIFRPFLTRVAPIFDNEGKVRRWLGINIDISEAQAASAELERRVEARTAELSNMARELEEARHVADEANQAKTRFLAGMSHELRTPLNGVLGYAQVLRLEGGLNATQRERVDAMLAAGKHLLGLITSVLDISEIEAGHLTLQMEEVDLPDLSSECLDVVAAIAQEKRLSLDISIERGAPRKFVTDPTRLRQVLLNLLGNAVKFTVEGGIELRLRRPTGEAGLRIEVTDTGPGIAPPLQARLFQEFGRLRTDDNAKIEGSGLGLAFSARLVAMMGGSIGFHERTGGGSVFWFELPPAAILSPRHQVSSKSQPPSCADKSKQCRILVVDDVEINLEIAQAFLRDAGYQVTCVSGGSEAVAAAANDDEYDVILMDVSMPEIDGLEATRRIRRLPGPRGRRPIVGVTAHVFADTIAECFKAGMDEHLSKPFTYEALSETVSRALKAPARA